MEGDDMENFEALLTEHKVAVERFVKFRLPSVADTEDVLQEIYLSAYQNFSKLKNADSFKAWILGIARNKCNDWFRAKARML